MSAKKMRYNSFEWPSNPDNIKISCTALTSEYNMPFLKSTVKKICAKPRIISGSGYFFGESAEVFAERLKEEFDSPYPGLLFIPGFEPFFAVFSSLAVKKQSGDDSIYYEFQFSEGDTDKAELIAPSAECYNAKPGESIYDISAKFGVSVEKLLKLNGWITNPLRLGEGTVILR